MNKPLNSHNPFDVSDPFFSTIYQGIRGRLRTESLLHDLHGFLRENDHITHLVDIGCGDGSITAQLLVHFPHLRAHLFDPSEDMTEKALSTMRKFSIPSERYKVTCETFSDFGSLDTGGNTLYLCHGVINWVDDHEEFLKKLLGFAAYGNRISLLFGTIHGHFMEILAGGNIQLAHSLLGKEIATIPSVSYPGQMLKVFTPTYIESLLPTGMYVYLKAGVRCFTDLIPREMEWTEEAYRDYWNIETQVRTKSPHNSLGNLCHLLVGKK